MLSHSRSGVRAHLARNLNLIFPILIVSAVLVLVVPLPPALLDLFLAANITLSVVILLTTIQVGSPLEFNVFPALLLGTTLARLVLNVATTRLILSHGATEGTQAAGRVVEAFGEFVAAGSPVVGLIIFLILVTIQFTVITQGATRIGEVAARFALDGMPGRQMAVDADLANGLISKEEARAARQQIAQQADFYGAMDGASKFVRGDAVAGLVITAINIVGGLCIGMYHGMSLTEATSIFTTLTIGDGLVAQVPAFLISIAAGLLVTRTSVDSDLSGDVIGQVFRHPVVLYIAALFVSALAFTGLPAGPLLALGAGCAAIGWILQSSKASLPVSQPTSQPETTPAPTPAAVESKAALRIESLELELGIGLLRLADSASGGDLLQHITQLRHRIADELGFIVPKVRVTDNLRLDPRQFQIKLRGVPVAWGEAYADALLAVDVGGADDVPGIQTHEPATQRPARWIQPEQREAAIVAGWQVHSPQVFLIQQLAEVVRSHAAELLTRQQVQGLLNDLRSRVPQLVDELIPGVLKSAHVQQVLCNLLRERVAIRDLEVIIEALGQCCGRTTNPTLLTEGVRLALARTIVQQCRGSDRVLHAVALSDELEHALSESIHFDENDLHVNTTRSVRTALTSGLRERLKRLVLAGRHEVVVCRPEIRAGVRQLTARDFPRLSVLSHPEVTADTELVVHGTVDLPVAATTSQTPSPVNRIQRHTESVHAAERFARRETVTLATGGAR